MTDFIRGPSNRFLNPRPIRPPLPIPPKRFTCRQCGMFATGKDIEEHQCTLEDVQKFARWSAIDDGKGLQPDYFDSRHPPAPAPSPTPFILQPPSQIASQAQPIVLAQLDPCLLPSHSLDHVYSFPAMCAVYFALTPEGKVVYIGGSINVRQRFNRGHELLGDMCKAGSDRIALLEVEPTKLRVLERRCIAKFTPPLNKNQRDHVITTYLPQALHEQLLDYCDLHHYKLYDLYIAGLRLVLQADPDDLMTYLPTSAKPKDR